MTAPETEPAAQRVRKLRAELGAFHVAGQLSYNGSSDPGSADEAMGTIDGLFAAAADALHGITIVRPDSLRLSNPVLLQATEDLSDAIRLLEHTSRRTLAAPMAWDILNQLEPAATAIGQLASRVQHDLPVSLVEYDVFNEDGRDPAECVAEAEPHLSRARQLADDLVAELHAAQKAINGQTHNGPKNHHQPTPKRIHLPAKPEDPLAAAEDAAAGIGRLTIEHGLWRDDDELAELILDVGDRSIRLLAFRPTESTHSTGLANTGYTVWRFPGQFDSATLSALITELRQHYPLWPVHWAEGIHTNDRRL